MRKHQRKIVNELREIYQSKDVLRWLYLNQRIGGDRMPTTREMRILSRRVIRGVTSAVRGLADAFRGLGRAITSMTRSMRQSMIAMGVTLPEAPIMPHMGIDIAEPGGDRSISQQIMSRQIVDTQIIGKTPNLMIMLDEAESLDDETINKINKLHERGAGNGKAD